MKRKILIVFTFLLCFMFFGFLGNERYVEGATDMKLINTTPGEDASSSVNVVWHSKTISSYLELANATDTSFSNPVYKTPLKTEQRSFYDDRSKITYTFYKNDLTIYDLNPSTSYIYRIKENNLYSPVKSFKTAPREGSNILKTEGFNFVFLSDYHTWTNGPTRLQTAVDVYNKAKEKVNGNLHLTIHGGDMLAYGSSYDCWENISQSAFGMETMMAMTPGNHDFYDSSASTKGQQYFNTFLYNPQNGADGVKNLNYYFKYGNVLFISIDNESTSSSTGNLVSKEVALANQQAWFREVVENNPSQYIIVYNHRPFYTGGTSNSGHATKNRNNWLALYDEYGVDLSLSGHDHAYARTVKAKNGVATGTNEGTVYITGLQYGDRYKTLEGNPQFDIVTKVIDGNVSAMMLFNVNEERINLRYVDKSGNIIDEADILAQRDPIDYNVLDKDAIFDNIEYVYDNETKTITIKPNALDFQYLEKISLVASRPPYLVYNGIFDTINKTLTIPDIEQDKIYMPNVTLHFNDGSAVTKRVTINTSLPYGEISFNSVDNFSISYDCNLINNQITKYELYVNGELKEERDATQGEKLEKFFLSLNYGENQIELKAFDANGNERFTDLITHDMTLDISAIEIKAEVIEGQKTVTILNMTEADLKSLSVYYDNQLVVTGSKLTLVIPDSSIEQPNAIKYEIEFPNGKKKIQVVFIDYGSDYGIFYVFPTANRISAEYNLASDNEYTIIHYIDGELIKEEKLSGKGSYEFNNLPETYQYKIEVYENGYLIDTLEFDGGNFASIKTKEDQNIPQTIKILEGHNRKLALKLFYKDNLISHLYPYHKFRASVLDATIATVNVAINISSDGSMIFLFEPLRTGTTKLVVEYYGEVIEVDLRVDSYTLEYKDKVKVGEEAEVKTSIQDAVLKVDDSDVYEANGLKYKGIAKGETSLKVYSAEYGATIELDVEFTAKGCNSGTIVLPMIVLALGVGFIRGNNHLREDLEEEDKKKK